MSMQVSVSASTTSVGWRTCSSHSPHLCGKAVRSLPCCRQYFARKISLS